MFWVATTRLPTALRVALARDSVRAAFPLPNPAKLAGYRIRYGDPQDFRQSWQEVFVKGTYLFESDKPAPRIIDAGANIGLATLYFKLLYPRARVLAIEAAPATFGLLAENVAANVPDVAVEHCALGGSDGEADFFSLPGSPLGSLDGRSGGGERARVPMRRLSGFLDEEVDLLKIDIEGAEREVLPELAAAGKLRRARQIHLEYHHHLSPDEDRLSETLRLLEEHGFGYRVSGWRYPGRVPEPGQVEDVAIWAYRK